MKQDNDEPSINLGLLKYRIDKKINKILDMLISNRQNDVQKTERYHHRRIQTQAFEKDGSNTDLSKLSCNEMHKEEDVTEISIRIANKTQGDLSIDGFPLSSREKKANLKAEKKIGAGKKSYTERQIEKNKKSSNLKMSDIKYKSNQLTQTSRKNATGKTSTEIKLEKKNIFLDKVSGKKKADLSTPSKRPAKIIIQKSLLSRISAQIKKNYEHGRQQKLEAYLTREKMLERIAKNCRDSNKK